MSCRPIAVIVLIGVFAVAGCVETPVGPTIQVLAGPSESHGAF